MTNEECIKILQQVKDGDLLTFDKSRRKALDMAIETMSNSTTQMSETSGSDNNVGGKDVVYRQDAIEAVKHAWAKDLEPSQYIESLPSAQPELLSDAYTKAVWTWLLEYQIKVAELKGRYTPYEVLSWVTNDWRKEHEQSN